MTTSNPSNNISVSQLMKHPFETGNIKVDFSQNMISRHGKCVILPPKILELLILLCSAQGQTLSKQELIDELWPKTVVGPDSLANAMTRLRKALKDDAKNPQFIQTVQRKGYRWQKPIQLLTKDSFLMRSIKYTSLLVVLIAAILLWQKNTEKLPVKFPFTDLSVEKLDDGGYEIQVGVEGELTEEKKAVMLEEIKRITGENDSGMVFTVDKVKPICDSKKHKDEKNCKN